MESTKDYVRVGINYFKLTKKQDRHNTIHNVLEPWNRQTILDDYGKDFLKEIEKYDNFILEPSHQYYERKYLNNYNVYNEFPHVAAAPPKGSKHHGIYWTHILMREIFGEQYKLGFQYMKVLYERPKQILPILVVLSELRETGKSTFLDWLNAIFGYNMVQISPETIGQKHNDSYATANIIAIDETLIEKRNAVEKIKSLATAKYIMVDPKFIKPYKVPFFGKLIMATNREHDFMRIEEAEIRFWVRRLKKPRIKNSNILEDVIKEIPYFLHYLENMPDINYNTGSRMVFTKEQLHNEALQKVMDETGYSGLYHNLKEHFTEYFLNEGSGEVELLATPRDIKDMWFKYDNSIDMKYIRKTLKNEYKFENENVRVYRGLNPLNSKTGRPFSIPRKIFLNGETANI